MSWSQTDLDALNTAIATGTLSVRYSDRQVTYRSLSEMLTIRNLMMDELQLAGAMSGEIRKISYSKGIE